MYSDEMAEQKEPDHQCTVILMVITTLTVLRYLEKLLIQFVLLSKVMMYRQRSLGRNYQIVS
jgi:hypothetical protein